MEIMENGTMKKDVKKHVTEVTLKWAILNPLLSTEAQKSNFQRKIVILTQELIDDFFRFSASGVLWTGFCCVWWSRSSCSAEFPLKTGHHDDDGFLLGQGSIAPRGDHRHDDVDSEDEFTEVRHERLGLHG